MASLYCVIDIGSNTIRLVVYRVDDGKIKAILNNKYTAGLAGYVDDKNFMSQKGINKLITILKEFKEVIAALPDCRVYPFATASLRNIVNTEQVLELVYQELGSYPDMRRLCLTIVVPFVHYLWPLG